MKIATGSFSKHVNKTQSYDSKSLNISYQLTFAAMGRLKMYKYQMEIAKGLYLPLYSIEFRTLLLSFRYVYKRP